MRQAAFFCAITEAKTKMLEIKGKVNTAICYAKVIEDEAVEQIRRMCEEMGCRVMKLKRVRILDIELGDLAIGEYRKATKKELDSVTALMDH